MNKTLQKTLLCATIATFAQNSIALDYPAAFQADKDACMEFIFFNEVKKAKKKGWKPVETNIKAAAALVSAATGLYLLQNPMFKTEQSQSEEFIQVDAPKRINITNFNTADLIKEGIKWGLLIVPAAYIIDTYWYKEISKNINDTANQTVLLDFLTNWETNKEYTPEKYHTFFDALAAAAQTEEGRAEIAKNAGTIIETVQFIIQRTKLEVSDVFKKGAFGKEGTDIYEVKPSFKFLKDFSPLKDAASVVDSLFGSDKK